MPHYHVIDDPDDGRVSVFRHVRERDLVGRQGYFIAEGESVLRLLIDSPRYQTHSVLIDERRVAKLNPQLGKLPADVPVLIVGRAILDAIIGFPLHRGILALGKIADPLEPAELLRKGGPDAVSLVLIGLTNHDNMGGILRNAAAFGASSVLIDATCCDPLYRKAIRVSVGAALTVPWARVAPGTDLPALLDEAGYEALAFSPAGSLSLVDYRQPGRVAVLLGTEGPGLPAALLARTRTVRIPMAGGFDSLNVATASAVALFHLTTAAAGRIASSDPSL